VRFIELMPTVSRKWWQRHFMPMAEVRRRLMPLGALIPVESDVTAGPARIFRVGGFAGELGFISPMSAHHCETCNRLRLTAAGGLRHCLFMDSTMDLKGPLRSGSSDGYLAHLFQTAMQEKLGRGMRGAPGIDRGCLDMAGIGG
jgi:cyclic pyranopterin phosphate synthase